MRSTTVSGFRLVRFIALAIAIVAMMAVMVPVASAQTPAGDQYGSPVNISDIGQWGGGWGAEVSSKVTGLLPDTGGVSLLLLGAALMLASTGLVLLRRSGRRGR